MLHTNVYVWQLPIPVSSLPSIHWCQLLQDMHIGCCQWCHTARTTSQCVPHRIAPKYTQQNSHQLFCHIRVVKTPRHSTKQQLPKKCVADGGIPGVTHTKWCKSNFNSLGFSTIDVTDNNRDTKAAVTRLKLSVEQRRSNWAYKYLQSLNFEHYKHVSTLTNNKHRRGEVALGQFLESSKKSVKWPGAWWQGLQFGCASRNDPFSLDDTLHPDILGIPKRDHFPIVWDMDKGRQNDDITSGLPPKSDDGLPHTLTVLWITVIQWCECKHTINIAVVSTSQSQAVCSRRCPLLDSASA